MNLSSLPLSKAVVVFLILVATKIKNTTTALLRGRLDKFIKILFRVGCLCSICNHL